MEKVAIDRTRRKRGVNLLGQVNFRGTLPYRYFYVFIGSSFTAVGLFVLWSNSDFSPPEWRWTPRLPLSWVAFFGGLFTVVGVSGLVEGFRVVMLDIKNRELHARYNREPWISDYRWNRAGISDGAQKDALAHVFSMFFLVVFLAPFNSMFFFPSPTIVFLVVTLVFDALAIWFFVRTIVRVRQLMKFGSSFFRFKSFPFFLGDTLSGEIENKKGLNRFPLMSVRLSCVEELEEGDLDNRKLVQYEMYSAKRDLVQEMDYWGSSDRIPITFDLPEGGRSTTLSKGKCVYWELEVEARDSGPGFTTSFLVPVYSRPVGQSILP